MLPAGNLSRPSQCTHLYSAGIVAAKYGDVILEGSKGARKRAPLVGPCEANNREGNSRHHDQTAYNPADQASYGQPRRVIGHKPDAVIIRPSEGKLCSIGVPTHLRQ